MTKKQIERLISCSIKSAPDGLWKRIKRGIARDIADELLTKLEMQKEPRKRVWTELMRL